MATLMLTVVLLNAVLADAPEQQRIEQDDVVASIVTEGDKGSDPTQVLRSIELLRDSLAKGKELKEIAAKKLLSVVANAQANGLVRQATLKFLCDYATSDSAEEIVAVMVTLLQRLPRPKNDQKPDSEYYAIPGLLRTFVTEGAKALDLRLKDPALLLEFHAAIVEDQGFHFENIRQGCLERIADSRAPLKVRQAYMLRLIQGMANRPGPEAFFVLVDADVTERLRRIALEETSGSLGYNATAMGLLAEFGDMEAGRWFLAWALERGYDEATVKRVGGYVWQIEAQHKPDMLLDHIRASERASIDRNWVMLARHRLWALKKAIHLRVDRGELRSALMEHFQQVGSKRIVDPTEEALSILAVESGIVKTEDLPAVILSPQDQRKLKFRRAIEATQPKKRVVNNDED